MRQPQHLTDFPHRHSHLRHRPSLLFLTGTADLLIRMSTGVLAKHSSETVRNHRNAVRNASEWLSAMGRNPQDGERFNANGCRVSLSTGRGYAAIVAAEPERLQP